MKRFLTTSLAAVIVLVANLIGLIAIAAAASVLVGDRHGNSHLTHHAPLANACAETCPLPAR